MVTFDPSLELNVVWPTLLIGLVILTIIAHLAKETEMKDINITLWTGNKQYSDEELQDKFVKFCDTLEDVEQFEVTVETS